MPETHDLSLVIAAHRGGRMLDACLDSAAALEPAPREVIVAIDGDDELVVKKAASLGLRVVACATLLAYPGKPKE
jgi:glycosyltransferase involved in cell wall biosynthesis